MIKKLFQTLLLVIAILLLVAPQLVMALEIEVLPNGQVIFYQSSILGKGSDGEEDGADDQFRVRIRTINSWERKEIKIRTRDDRVEVEIRERNGDFRSRGKFELKEETETDELRFRFPSSADELEVDESDSQELKSYRKKLFEERKERGEETVELRNKVGEGINKLQIESRQARASLSQGASFVLDPSTNQVVIVTPSGQEHILYHLPDQAILRMQEAGLLSLTAEGEIKEAEIETTEDGRLVYRVRDIQRKRFLGIFRRDVPKEVELDDDTGEVTERPVEDRTLIETVLDSLSF